MTAQQEPLNKTKTNEIQLQETNLRDNGADFQDEEAKKTRANNDGGSASSSTVETITARNNLSSPFRFVPLSMGGGGRTHMVTNGSRRLMEQEAGLADLQKMTESFYEKAFQDATLDQFIHSHNDPHGNRFAKWIHQKLSGSNVWDQDRRTRDRTPKTLAGGHQHVVHDRSSAHVAAWYSTKRPVEDQGHHFKLDEARVWMRLHFWAMRDTGLLETAPSFADYYVRFIGHFMRVYEGTAPMFARESLRWSANPANIESYVASGRRMTDVLGLSLVQAERQLPSPEAADMEWPYNTTAQNASVEPEAF